MNITMVKMTDLAPAKAKLPSPVHTSLAVAGHTPVGAGCATQLSTFFPFDIPPFPISQLYELPRFYNTPNGI